MAGAHAVTYLSCCLAGFTCSVLQRVCGQFFWCGLCGLVRAQRTVKSTPLGMVHVSFVRMYLLHADSVSTGMCYNVHVDTVHIYRHAINLYLCLFASYLDT